MEETGKYLEPLIGKATDGLSAAKLHEKTEGWVTGMHLLLLTLETTAGPFPPNRKTSG